MRWLYFSVVLQGITVTGVLSLMPVYLTQNVGTSELIMGILLGINPTLQILLMYPMGTFSDRVGRKSLIVIGTFGQSVVFPVLAAVSTSFVIPEIRILVVTAGFVVLAVTFSAMFSGTVAFIGDVTPEPRSGGSWVSCGPLSVSVGFSDHSCSGPLRRTRATNLPLSSGPHSRVARQLSSQLVPIR